MLKASQIQPMAFPSGFSIIFNDRENLAYAPCNICDPCYNRRMISEIEEQANYTVYLIFINVKLAYNMSQDSIIIKSIIKNIETCIMQEAI